MEAQQTLLHDGGMKIPELNDNTFLLFAAQSYDRSSCIGIKEFYEDLGRIKYIKGLLKRYKKTGNLSERLLLNHFIVFIMYLAQR